MCEVYHRAKVLPGVLLFHWGGIIGKERLLFMISTTYPISSQSGKKILEAQRKLVIVISHLSPTRHRDAEMHLLGCARESRQNKLFVYFGSLLQLWDGCQVYGYAPALLPAYFFGVYFISGQKWQRSTASHSVGHQWDASMSHFGNVFELSDRM